MGFLSTAAAGRIMVGIGLLGLVASIAGAVVGRQLIADLDDGVGQSLALSAEVLETVDESFVVADETLHLIEDGIAEAANASRSLGRSLEEGRSALDAASGLTGEDIAGTVDAVESALPAVEDAATAIDRTMAALDALPFDLGFSPDAALGESIQDVRAELEGLPDDLRAQAEEIDRTGEELGVAAEDTLAFAEHLVALRDGLEQAGALVEQYAERTTEAHTLVAEQRESFERSTSRAAIAVVVLGLALALGQFVPIYFGAALIRGQVLRLEPPDASGRQPRA